MNICHQFDVSDCEVLLFSDLCGGGSLNVLLTAPPRWLGTCYPLAQSLRLTAFDTCHFGPFLGKKCHSVYTWHWSDISWLFFFSFGNPLGLLAMSNWPTFFFFFFIRMSFFVSAYMKDKGPDLVHFAHLIIIIIFLLRKDALNWSNVKDIYNISFYNISISNKFCCFEICTSKNSEKK